MGPSVELEVEVEEEEGEEEGEGEEGGGEINHGRLLFYPLFLLCRYAH